MKQIFTILFAIVAINTNAQIVYHSASSTHTINSSSLAGSLTLSNTGAPPTGY